MAGRNFGCGSSREHAPIALLNMGAAAVLADSFARIFFRNAINLGLPVIVCRGIGAQVKTGDHVTLDLEAGTAAVLESGKILSCDRLGEQAQKILSAGGIKPLMRQRPGRIPIKTGTAKNHFAVPASSFSGISWSIRYAFSAMAGSKS